MKKGFNVLWIGFLLLIAVVILLSQLDCVRFVPTHLEGIPIQEDSEHGGMTNGLPDPTYHNAFGIIVRCSLICAVVFLFHNMFLNVVGNIIALFQAMAVCFFSQISNYIWEMEHSASNGIGEVHGYYEPTIMCFFLGGLCIFILAYSVFLTKVYASERKREDDHS